MPPWIKPPTVQLSRYLIRLHWRGSRSTPDPSSHASHLDLERCLSDTERSQNLPLQSIIVKWINGSQFLLVHLFHFIKKGLESKWTDYSKILIDFISTLSAYPLIKSVFAASWRSLWLKPFNFYLLLENYGSNQSLTSEVFNHYYTKSESKEVGQIFAYHLLSKMAFTVENHGCDARQILDHNLLRQTVCGPNFGPTRGYLKGVRSRFSSRFL